MAIFDLETGYFEYLKATILTFLTLVDKTFQLNSMKRNYLLFFILPFLLFSFGTEVHRRNNDGKKSTILFNGKNLDGWKMKIAGFPLGENFGNTFRVENGILSIRYDQYGDNFNNRFGALYCVKKFSNYRLKVEYRFVGETAPGAPSWDTGIAAFNIMARIPLPWN